MGREHSNVPATGSGTRIVRVKWTSRTAGFANDSVESIILKACKHFRLGPVQAGMVLLGKLDGEELEVTDDLLELFPKGATLTLSRIQQEPPRAGRVARGGVEDHVCRADERREYWPSSSGLAIDVRRPAGMFVWIAPLNSAGVQFPVLCELSDTVDELRYKIESRLKMLATSFDLLFDGGRLGSTQTHSQSGIRRESVIDLVPVLVGGKPVIYLFPPHPIADATVSVSLAKQWSFSHLYPMAAQKQVEDGRQRVAWSVSAQPDGTLVEKGSGLELSYLFWEAESKAFLPPSPPLNPVDARTEHFDPAYPVLDCDTPTAVLLPFAELLPYLDATLKKLSLHTSARNDFITYWLPKLAKKPFVALRFLPQPAYERAAGLEVTPKPDVVTRVFMLFRGITAQDAAGRAWAAARARVGEVDWVRVVGVEDGAWDEGLFRVLEWGAMEVL